MSILVDKDTKAIVQGITGQAGAFHTERMLADKTQIVGGVTPGKAGTKVHGVPVFDSVRQAVDATGATASVIFVPAPFAYDAILEAADAGIGLIVVITEGIPTLDMVRAKRVLRDRLVRIIGPNCPGLITPEACKLGILPGYIHRRGPIGVISRSGTLTYDTVFQLTEVGLGQSTCVGIGGDPVLGSEFVDILQLFEQDPQTEAVVMIGEIGGTMEEQAAAFIKAQMTKPAFSFIAGRQAPPEKRMGHAGAIVSGGRGTAVEKLAALRAAGVTTIEDPSLIGKTVKEHLTKRGLIRV